MKKLARMLAAAGLTTTLLLSMTGCDVIAKAIFAPIFDELFKDVEWEFPKIPSFEERCVTTEDGFTYCLNKEGACIIKLPETEKVTIPEYLDGYKVVQLGYETSPDFTGETSEHWLVASHVKELTIQHRLYFRYVKGFTALEKVIYIDYLDNITLDTSVPYLKSARVFNTLNNMFKGSVKVELRKGDRAVDLSAYSLMTIEIPEYVTVIEEGVFDGLEGVTIKTEYESKPDGWEEGWNGNCEVEWGVDLGY